ncbi:hypothetical protein CMU57_06250 [Elizabethkingia anophelis]|nr:hypothetical protein [Elizabethkingia anophelis]MDV3723796.1 hypothetical protein [Elizabethkingia anophelis]
MRNLTILPLLILLIFTACSKKIKVDQNFSNEYATLHLNINDTSNRIRDSVNIILPLEFKFNIKPKQFTNFSTSITINKDEYKRDTNGYLTYNKKSKRTIYNKRIDFDQDEKVNLLIKLDGFNLSYSEAEKLLDYYKTGKTTKDINSIDSLRLAPYSQIRKDFPFIVKRLNKVNDSISFMFGLNGDKLNTVKTIKIDW